MGAEVLTALLIRQKVLKTGGKELKIGRGDHRGSNNW